MAAMIAKRYRGFVLPLILVACAQAPEGPERVVEPRVSAQAAPRGSALLKSVMLAAHNGARGDVGVAPLVWSDTLVASARGYAEDMARSGRFEHAAQPMAPGRLGENLWTGTRGAYRYDEMAGHWIAERGDFVNLPTPNFSRTGRAQDVTHYTQIVWRGSTAVGCALASNRTDDFLVCRYAPAGNVMGQAAY